MIERGCDDRAESPESCISSDHVRVVVRPHPFLEKRTIVDVPAGRTVSELLTLAGLPESRAGKVFLDGTELTPERMGERPDPGQLVTARAVPRSDSGILMGPFDLNRRTNGVYSNWHNAIPGYAPFYHRKADSKIGAIETQAAIGFGMGAMYGGIYGGIAGAIGGAYNGYNMARAQERAENFTLPENRGSVSKTRRFITGSRNELRPYGPVPCVLGYRVRYRPPLAAKPYTAWRDNKQVFHLLYTFGHGPVRLENHKFGDTPIANLGISVLAHGQTTVQNGDATMQVREGWGDDDVIAFYLDNVSEESLQVQLSHEVPHTSTLQDWSVRRTDYDVSRIGVEVRFPKGLKKFDETDQSAKAIEVEIEVQYAPAAATHLETDWKPAFGRGADLKKLKQSGIRVKDARGSDFSVGIDWDVTAGQYDVRLRRKTADRGGLVLDETWWSLLRNYRLGNPIRLTGLCTVSMELQPTRTLTGELDNYNAEASFMGPYYDSGTAAWVTPTRSSTPSLAKSAQPAAHFRYILCGAANRAALSTARLDLANLAAWAVATEAAGLHFNGVVDTTSTVLDMLNDVASYGRGSYMMRDGLHGVVYDLAAQGAQVQTFTPREYWNFSGSIDFPDPLHAITVEYVDTNVEAGLASVIVYDDGYNADGSGGKTAATLFSAISLVYCQSKEEAWKHGRRFLAERRLRRSRYSFECLDGHLVCTRGDLVVLVTEMLDTQVAVGRVTLVALNGSGDALSVTFDEAVTINSASSYVFRFRKADGSFLDRAITTPGVSGEYQTLTFAVPIPAASPQPVAPDLFMFSTSATLFRRCIVWSVEHMADNIARLTLIDEKPDVYTADGGSPAAYTNITSAPGATSYGGVGTPSLSVTPLSNSSFPGIGISITVNVGGAGHINLTGVPG